MKAASASRTSLTKEGAGYLAMLAFLSAYLLSVADAGHLIQGLLNLIGAGVAATYLYGKRAIPSVICNLAWGVITVAGLLLA